MVTQRSADDPMVRGDDVFIGSPEASEDLRRVLDVGEQERERLDARSLRADERGHLESVVPASAPVHSVSRPPSCAPWREDPGAESARTC